MATFQLKGGGIPLVLDFLRRMRGRKRLILSEIPEGIREHLLISGIVLPGNRIPREILLNYRLCRDHAESLLQRRYRPLHSDEMGPMVFNREGVASVSPPPHARNLFVNHPPILWIRDPLTRGRLPCWPSASQLKRIQGLAENRRAGSLTSVEARLFGDHCLMVPETKILRQSNRRVIIAGRTSLKENGYALIHGFMPRSFATGLETYYQKRIEQGFAVAGDPRVAERHVEVNEPIAVYLLEEYKKFISMLAGRPLRCSNTYVSTYWPGSSLPKHRDSARSELTLSIQLTSSPVSWPIFLGDEKIELSNPGDAVLFFGHQKAHLRPRLSSGRSHTQLLMHYRSI